MSRASCATAQKQTLDYVPDADLAERGFRQAVGQCLREDPRITDPATVRAAHRGASGEFRASPRSARIVGSAMPPAADGRPDPATLGRSACAAAIISRPATARRQRPGLRPLRLHRLRGPAQPHLPGPDGVRSTSPRSTSPWSATSSPPSFRTHRRRIQRRPG